MLKQEGSCTISLRFWW